jgi:hypothetical protein
MKLIENERVFDKLRTGTMVAVERGGAYEIVYPRGHAGPFPA